MISSTELNYVSCRPKDIPFPGEKYASNALNMLREAFKIYEEKYQDKYFTIVLSNGEELKFSIKTGNLSHLLGIDINYLLTDEMAVTRDFVLGYGLYDSVKAYDLLKIILDKTSEIIQNDSNYNNYKILNYYKIYLKCYVFKNLVDFTSFNFGCINFDKNTFYQCTGKDYRPNSNKILFMPSYEKLVPYFMMGLISFDSKKNCAPETLFAARDHYDYFVGQELLIPTEIITHDKNNLSKITASSSDKLYLLKMYRSIIEYYDTNSYINIFNDYENMIINDSLKEKKMSSKI